MHVAIDDNYTPANYTGIIIQYDSNYHKAVGVAHEIKSPKNQPQFSLTTTRQYWLGETKPKQAFRSTQNAFNKLLWNLKKNYSTEFSTD